MVDGLMQLVAGRFLALVWHGIATVVLILGKTPLIQIEVDPGATVDLRIEQFEYIDTWLTALLTLAILCMVMELAGLLSGYTIHQKNVNVVSALSHVGGFLSTVSTVLNGWSVRVYPCVFTICSLVPAALDVLWWTFHFQTLARKLGPR
eukprot:g11724.t1